MSRRVERVQSLIRHELGQILQQDVKDPRIDGLVSIIAVEVTPDLRLARVFLSIYGTKEQEKEALGALKSAQPFLRRELGSRLDLRYAPELDLRLDHSLQRADEVSRLLKKLPPPAVR
ncbi:MAG: 30S ribosome-binding factor RbfA [Chloroflexota bacterium]